MRKDAGEIIYDEGSLLGIPALLTDWRVERSTVPAGFHLYELRHTDEDWGDPCQLARSILVNFYGSILSMQPFQLPEHGYLDFDSKDLIYVEADSCATVEEFQQKYGRKEV